MEQELKHNMEIILNKLNSMQSDIHKIKDYIELKEEIADWEEAGAEDSAEFFEKNGL